MLARNVSASHLIKVLSATYGYEITRQKGSHIRLTSTRKGTHRITVPKHDPIKIGTLSSIVKEVAEHFETTKDDVIKKLGE